MSEIDLAYHMAMKEEDASQQKDTGTSLKHPTLRKGVVTTAAPLQVDGLPASNITGASLTVGAVVWLLVDAGRRLVIGPSTPTFPPGIIVMWSGSSSAVPAGWALCNGANGTPDLRGRFVVGAGSGSGYSDEATGGANTVALSVSHMPAHNHGSEPNHTHNQLVRSFTSTGDVNHDHSSSVNRSQNASTQGSNETQSGSIQGAGGHTHSTQGSGSAHENRPPYYALAYIMKL